MPTYEYRCAACEHEFEEFQSITARPLKKCPACGRRKLQRLIGSGGGIIFKGSGFHQTDYRSESYKKSAAAEKKSISAAADGKDKGSPDSKSTPKKETPPSKNSTAKADKVS